MHSIRQYLTILLTVISLTAEYDICESSRLSDVTIVDRYGMSYLSLVKLAGIFKLETSYNPVLQSMTVKRNGRQITFFNGLAHARTDGELHNIGKAPFMTNGALNVPAETSIPLLASLLPGELTWNSESHRIEAAGVLGILEAITFEERQSGTLIRIGLAEHLTYRDEIVERKGERILNIEFREGTYDPKYFVVAPPRGLVESVKVFPGQENVIVSFTLSEETEKYDITNTDDSSDLLVSLRRSRTDRTETATDSAPVDIPSIIDLDSSNLWRIDTVIIDAGHGGKDPGAIGKRGTQEKDVVLAISKEIKKIADSKGEIKAVLTRDTDEFVPLYARYRKAIQANGKLFVSIHANAARSRTATGIEAFFLSEAKTEDARRLAEKENAVIHFEDNPGIYAAVHTNENMPQELRGMHGDMAANVYLKESQAMCAMLLDSALSRSRQENRGVKQAPFLVLKGTQAAMPSVLLETGFISNPDEEKLLARASYQKRIAEAVYEAIISFKRNVEKDLFSATGAE